MNQPLTLRDAFAAHAITGLLSARIEDAENHRVALLFQDDARLLMNPLDGSNSLAKLAYEIADEMIIARGDE